jgi:hypothetical protein
MITPDPSAPIPVLFGIVFIFVIIIIRDEFKRNKNKS